MKKNLFLLLLLLFTTSLFVVNAQTAVKPFGEGTTEQPYRISNIDNLYWLTQNDASWSKHFIQTVNIDATSTSGWDAGAGFLPIGDNSPMFRGTYDGQGHTVDGLFINRPSASYVGMFGYVYGSSSEIKNLGLTNCNITGKSILGAIVGIFRDGKMAKCYSTGAVEAESIVGGLVGYPYNSCTIKNSYTNADVTRTSGSTSEYVGAFIGRTFGTPTIENCYATGNVEYDGTTNPTDKGFSGHTLGIFNNNFFDGEVSNQTSATGAIAKTTTQMQDIATFTDNNTVGLTTAWDFLATPNNDSGTDDIWGINKNSYPHFLTGVKEAEGAGTVNSPYKIANLENLYWLMTNSDKWEAYYEQTADIDAYATIAWDEKKGFTPLGNNTIRFKAIYNGKNHVIDNLYINRSDEDCVGFFGYISDISSNEGDYINNLGLTNCDITGDSYTGGLFGIVHAYRDFENCYVTGNITGGNYTGGLFGYISGGSKINVKQCYTDCNVTGEASVGGFVGYANPYSGVYAYSFKVYSSHSAGTVTGNDNVGGFVGYSRSAYFYDSYSMANVVRKSGSVNTTIAAFMGSQSSGGVSRCYATGSVTYEGATNPTNKGFTGSSAFSHSDNYFDNETSGQTSAAGASPKTTVQMQTQATFTNWDFVGETTNGTDDIWGIDATVNAGYPYFAAPIGSGTGADPYQIATLDDLKWLSESATAWDKNFIQTADIDVAYTTITSIGNNTNKFTGSYDGQDYSINKLKIVGTNNYVGLFGFVNSNTAELKNINLIDADVSGGNNSSVGILVGNLEDGSVVSCYTSGTVTSRELVGGLIGRLVNGSVSGSSSSAIVSTNYQYGGGLIGYTSGATISQSYSTGDIENGVSGLGNWLGGFIGNNNSSTISQCYSTGNVTGSGTYNGGFAGYTNGTMSNCYSKGNVTRVNGATGTSVGAFAGNAYNVSNCYAIGSVYYTGVTDPTDKGFASSGSSVSNCFFDLTVSNQSTNTYATGATSTNMKIQSTFITASWDFLGEDANGTDDYWYISSTYNDGYPGFIYIQGEGTVDHPYEIATLEDLYWLSQTESAWAYKYFIQTADIDASETSTWDMGDHDNDGGTTPEEYMGFSPIGNLTTIFTGNYDGQGYSISNLYINRLGYEYIGLFGKIRTSGEKISNLDLLNCDITGKRYVGGLIGYRDATSSAAGSSNSGTISNCRVSGNLYAEEYFLGGLGGYIKNTNISSCSSSVTLNTGSTGISIYGGGLIGFFYSYNNTISESYSEGTVNGGSDENFGGLIL